MNKFELAIKEAEQLPEELREELGEKLLRYIYKYLALRDAIDEGIRDLDAGRTVDGEEVLASLKARYRG